MGKSIEDNYINIIDLLEEIKSKVAKIPTDTEKIGEEVPKESSIANLFTSLKLFTNDETYKKYSHDYNKANIRYKDLKEQLSNAIYNELKPLQERSRDLEKIQNILTK